MPSASSMRRRWECFRAKARRLPDALLHDGLWVADAVYSPLWTPLLLAAKARNARIMNGGELAIYQAVDAFELFTGLTPSIIEMRKAFDGVMAKATSAFHAGASAGS